MTKFIIHNHLPKRKGKTKDTKPRDDLEIHVDCTAVQAEKLKTISRSLGGGRVTNMGRGSGVVPSSSKETYAFQIPDDKDKEFNRQIRALGLRPE